MPPSYKTNSKNHQTKQPRTRTYKKQQQEHKNLQEHAPRRLNSWNHPAMAMEPKSRRFAVACGVLSQYVKAEKSRSSVFVFRPAVPPMAMSLMTWGANVSSDQESDMMREEEEGTFTMELFPQSAGDGRNPAKESAPQGTQLTMFYGGKVLVFDDFPADKANDLMQLAGNGSNVQRPDQPNLSDIPIARKASLQRFLEKRKDRVNAKAPYHRSPVESAVKKEKHEGSWLGLGTLSTDSCGQ